MQSGMQHIYELGSSVGQGSYGQVYGATDKKTDKATGKTTETPVVIKKIHDLDDPKVAVYTLRELTILRLLKHPHIIELKNTIDPRCHKENDCLFLVFEKMETDLNKIFRSKQLFSDIHIQYFLLQLLLAVHYLHSAGIVHRDLKPANILVNANCTLKLCDLGASRIIQEPTETKAEENTDSLPPRTRQLTQHVVTRWYRAPDVIQQADYGPPIDMWSIGCILAQLFMMKRPKESRHVLFAGDYCSPLSPPEFQNSGFVDQLAVILSRFKKPSDEDLAAICPDEEARKKLGSLFLDNPQTLEEQFSFIEDEQAIDLLKRLLELNPNKRITAKEALEHPFLAPVIKSYQESTQAPLPVSSYSNKAALAKYMAFEDELEKQKNSGEYPDIVDIQNKILAEIDQHYSSAQKSKIVCPEQKFSYSLRKLGCFPGPNPYTVTGLPPKTAYSGPALK